MFKKSVFHLFSVLIVLVSMLGFESSSSVFAKNSLQELKSDIKGLQKSNQCLGAGAETAHHALTGKVRFVGTKPDKPIQHPVESLSRASPEAAARGYLSRCGSIFGLSDQAAELVVKRQKKTEDGRSVIRFQQNYQGIPILGGELVVQLNSANDIILVNGDILPRIRLSVKADIDASVAQQTALQMVADQYGVGSETLKVSEAQLRIYSPALIQARAGTAALVWQMEVTPIELAPIREFVLIDAQLGTVALNFNQVDTAKNRLTYTAGNTTTRPGTLVCNESNPTCSGGDTDAVNAHVYGGSTYDFYFSYHGRDSINNAGMSLISTVHYSSGYCNAFWDGFQMTYGDGCFIVVDDVVAHEMTHGVTENESGLIYSYESGAINESFSDIWGEFVDLTYETDLPADRWLMGEDTSIGAIRNMKDPTTFGDPDRMDSPNFYHGSGDNGGVHINSGVGNKAAYLITDGDTFNGYTVTGLGITKAAKIYYEAQTNILTPTSNYYSLYNALYQACNNLIGTSGIIAADCTEVQEATLATEMDHYPPPTAPANDDISAPVEIGSLPYTNTQSTGGATTAAGDPVFVCLTGQRYNSVWYSYTPASSQTLTIDTFGSDYDTVLSVWTGSPGSLVSVACNDDTSGFQSQVTASVTTGATYYIEIASYGGSGGALTLNAASDNSTPVAVSLAGALFEDQTLITSADFVTIANLSQVAVFDTPLGSFPRGADGNFAVMSTGNTDSIPNPGTFASTSFGGGHIRGNSDYDVAILQIDFTVPEGMSCLTFNTRFFSEEYPVFVGSQFNDAFIAELDNNTWTVSNGVITAPDNFADISGDNISVNSLPMSASNGIGTAFDGTENDTNGGASTLGFLAARTPLTSGDHTLYLSIFDQSDHIYDSAVFIDNLVIDNTELCDSGGVYYEPEMDVQGNSVSIADGSTSPLPLNGTDFGNVNAATGAANHVFTIINTGDYDLNLSGSPLVSISGTNAGDFTVISDPASTISGGGGTTTFTVQFDPSSDGYRTATISIANTDTDESPYDFTIQGIGIIVATYKSVATPDGWILESSETSGVGGSLSNATTTLLLGDNAANKQYRSILSFNTSSLPDNAVIISVALKFKHAGVSGTNPFNTHGKLLADIRKGVFGGNIVLQNNDFSATANKNSALVFTSATVSNWYSKYFSSANLMYVNLTGTTQFRLRFTKDDNNDLGADFLKIYSGDAVLANRPQLIIKYYVP